VEWIGPADDERLGFHKMFQADCTEIGFFIHSSD
jgi:TRAP-type mannitol/chloroaromatic compound transport system substrate-binding protein